ncbi:MAG: type II secretion system protein GspG [Nitrospirae bacterium]|nr:type II secretion system protein GspG [Nitrospirota bacterium]
MRRHSVVFDKDGAGIVETLIIIIVISILGVVVVDRYESIRWEARKAAMQTELSNLRQAILLFKITKGTYPRSLRYLVNENLVVTYKDTIIKAKYLEPYIFDKDMNILDPFGMPFAYDPITGKVWSQKKGFENW